MAIEYRSWHSVDARKRGDGQSQPTMIYGVTPGGRGATEGSCGKVGGTEECTPIKLIALSENQVLPDQLIGRVNSIPLEPSAGHVWPAVQEPQAA
jgi:hypothetical protein